MNKEEKMAYWKQTNWNEYVLVTATERLVFKNYTELYDHCQRRGIDAKQV